MLCRRAAGDGEHPEAIRSVEALLHTSVMISLYDESGNAIYRNPAARRSAEAGGTPSANVSLKAPIASASRLRCRRWRGQPDHQCAH